jgi:hypothetical protein
MTPIPPRNAEKSHKTRTTVGSISRYSPRPPQMPASFLSFVDL